MSAKEFLEQHEPKVFHGTVEEQDGELFFVFPPGLMESMGWNEHTSLKWVVEDGKVFLKEVKDE